MDRRRFVQSIAASPLVLPLAGGRGWAEGAKGREIVPPKDSFVLGLPRLMELADVPGVGIGVVQGGKTTWVHYAGVANAKTKERIEAESLFPAASMGKPLFAFAVLRLVDDGRLDLDRPLKLYLKDDSLAGAYGEKVTARHVLSHSTGLPNWRDGNSATMTPGFEPGTKFKYSGEGFYLLQRCVEKITGVGCEAWMQQTTMKPLGMRSSTYLWNASAGTRLVAGHRGSDPFYNRDFAMALYETIEKNGKPLSEWNHDAIVKAMTEKMPTPHYLVPNELTPNVAFSLLTTVNDYSAFLGGLEVPVEKALELKPGTRQAMITPYSHINSALGWGLGWGIEANGGEKYLWQWGDNGGWKDFVMVHPESRSAVVVFTNGANGMHIAERVVQAATGMEQPVFLWV